MSFVPKPSTTVPSMETIDQQIDELLTQMRFVLGNEKTKQVFDEIQVGPEKFMNDERESYKKLSDLVIKKLNLTAKNLKISQQGEVDILQCFLQKQEQRLTSQCKWLAKRFKYIHQELTTNGESLEAMRIRHKKSNEQILGDKHIGHAIIFSRTPGFSDLKSIGINLNISEKELFEEVTGDLLEYMNKAQSEANSQTQSVFTPITSMIFTERVSTNTEMDKAFIRGNAYHPSFQLSGGGQYPMILGNLDMEYLLEARIASLERIRNCLVILNNLALYFTVPRNYEGLPEERVIVGIPDFKLPSTLQNYK